MRRSTLNISPTGQTRAFELLKIPAPSGQNGVHMPYRIFAFVCQMPLLNKNRLRFLWSVSRLVDSRYAETLIQDAESYFRRWLRMALDVCQN